MRVIFAYYGVSCANVYYGDLRHNDQYTSTNWAKSLCSGKNTCSGYVHTSILGDPYYGCHKDFLVVAECSNGQIIADLVAKEAQGRTFSLACN